MHIQRKLTLTFFLLLAMSRIGNVSASDPNAEKFVLHESLGQTWRNECVRFELTPRQSMHIKYVR